MVTNQPNCEELRDRIHAQVSARPPPATAHAQPPSRAARRHGSWPGRNSRAFHNARNIPTSLSLTTLSCHPKKGGYWDLSLSHATPPCHSEPSGEESRPSLEPVRRSPAQPAPCCRRPAPQNIANIPHPQKLAFLAFLAHLPLLGAIHRDSPHPVPATNIEGHSLQVAGSPDVPIPEHLL